jgi:hypothetical protein
MLRALAASVFSPTANCRKSVAENLFEVGSDLGVKN